MFRRVSRSAAMLPGHRCPAAVPAALQLTCQRRCNSHASQREETTLEEYAERRQCFLRHLPPHSIALLPAADEVSYSHDILCPHRQDSLWYHLFGLHTPLRRQLEPSSSTLTADVRATMAVFARGADNFTHTILCAPPVTVDPATVVWAAETTPRTSYEARLRAHTQTKEVGCIGSTSAVITNDVGTICDAVCRLITQMATQQIIKWAEAERAYSNCASFNPTAEERVARDRGDLLRIMPQIFAAYPQQLRWDGRRYRLPPRSRQQPQCEEVKSLQARPEKSQHTFHHPLEAFFHTLHSTAITVHLPRLFFDGTPQPPWDSATFHYKTAAAYTPGLVSHHPAPSTASAEAQIFIAASASGKWTSDSPTRTMRGEVRLPIRRFDAYGWSYRLLKSPSQVRQHLRSARATEHAFVHLMRRSATTAAEHDLHCAFQRCVCDCSAHFGAASRVRSAYIPVIASGVRSTDIHYTDNCAEVAAAADVGVVRVDAGVEVEYVPTDCTRTFPISAATFPCPQHAQLYDGLVRIQRSLLHRIAPGVAMSDVAKLHLDETRALLCSLGVDFRRVSSMSVSEAPRVSGGEDEGEEEQERQLPMSVVRACFCAHTFGHLFGLDIHEEWGIASPITSPSKAVLQGTTAAPAPHIFTGGMMHTVEPGVYMPSLARASLFGMTAAQLPDAFHRGIGMQVEDDVLILPLVNDQGNAAPREEITSCLGRWSRGTYLQHALAAFARYYGDARVCDVKSFRTPLESASAVVELCRQHVQTLRKAGAVASVLPTHEWNVVCFLFSQRLAMDGHKPAVAALASDIAAVQALTFVASPAYASASLLVPTVSHTEWYPYSVVVLTASVPKDRHWIEMLMRESL
ncbi:aminopeptidase P1 putativemetallo-peptidase Clan MG Family M24 [Leptomonas pyrrhocoris]|uniref:Aminopeptidase P1 putativemetallo-peptidase Clan MG Family M24 n=1 Tax=Leptomonas pyrrhocoris TaxID=157538 RepID=A0A0N0VFW5_LEPPY|nr:aminopeptidase P1 putativemetallo-peptidase Clan MG Family M24 [Leptomonas pyrrhocoris]XP_015660098.1 aminopeptidase P1 putativemetallo-peptidase Clan MG Family M24 [Leptomonas pyrrhocoris]KPA81658.1 aminopeptidase P1 putativemetallo-peptidase Clan MG Family M24 [Leptomonas pyrrhocoris]KPA81659.1 aminopeptidase P1 putativemetallo-peptidase Clan MG Family M24 [Leptomonas pyrrhocoris]|eukprot:XP_015660097.1 aminopeptidase P1 putativemetallo-peptidase Clan MG Family M24 [Leptomonas pyrrhocoris]